MNIKTFSPLRVIIIGFTLLLLSGCITPYQPDLQQGNILNSSDLNSIQLGMSKQEVVYILGTPLVSDPFNTNRWDYYYSNTNQRTGNTEERIITIIFENNVLSSVSGDVMLGQLPTMEDNIEDRQHGGTIITQPTYKEKGIWNRLFKSNKYGKKIKKGKKKEKNSEKE